MICNHEPDVNFYLAMRAFSGIGHNVVFASRHFDPVHANDLYNVSVCEGRA